MLPFPFVLEFSTASYVAFYVLFLFTYATCYSESKLETDEQILLDKARLALRKYGHKLVIANQLHTRKHRVILVEEDSHEEVTVGEDEQVEIEERIVEKVLAKHSDFMTSTL